MYQNQEFLSIASHAHKKHGLDAPPQATILALATKYALEELSQRIRNALLSRTGIYVKKFLSPSSLHPSLDVLICHKAKTPNLCIILFNTLLKLYQSAGCVHGCVRIMCTHIPVLYIKGKCTARIRIWCLSPPPYPLFLFSDTNAIIMTAVHSKREWRERAVWELMWYSG